MAPTQTEVMTKVGSSPSTQQGQPAVPTSLLGKIKGTLTSWLLPVTWPIGHISIMLSRPENDVPDKPKAVPIAGLSDHMAAVAASWRAAGMAYFCMYVLTKDYPAFGRAAVFSADWMWPIVVRNVVGAWAICGFWDWLLYFSPLKDKLHKYKFNKVYPRFSHFCRDAFWTTTAVIFAAGIEIVMCHLWASGRLRFQANLSETPISNFLWLSLIPQWRIPHFHLIHRAMHPWKTRSVPDVGAFLYRHVHSLHHKSYNPTAFSGTNMHPVESTSYFTAALIPVAFGCHPIVFVAAIVDLAVSAWLGHDGFQMPGHGDYFHQLHHSHFDCNYGTPHVPLDYWFGTFAGKKEDVAKIWANA